MCKEIVEAEYKNLLFESMIGMFIRTFKQISILLSLYQILDVPAYDFINFYEHNI